MGYGLRRREVYSHQLYFLINISSCEGSGFTRFQEQFLRHLDLQLP
jgi:hypothetical protein